MGENAVRLYRPVAGRRRETLVAGAGVDDSAAEGSAGGGDGAIRTDERCTTRRRPR